MSAPETKALPPAPVITTTRTSLSLAKPSMIRLAASHISNETALWRSGLLKIMYPTCPSLRDSILSVWVMAPWLLASGSCPGCGAARSGAPPIRTCSMGPGSAAHHACCAAPGTRVTRSNRVRLAERRDLLGAVADLLEHRGGVLAHGGRRGDELARRTRQRHGLAHQRERAALDRLGHPHVLDLRVGGHLVDRIDRPARHARRVEALDPVGA